MRNWRIVAAGCISLLALAGPVRAAENAPGVSDGEIKIGQTQPYSGFGAAFGAIGKAEAAYFKLINDAGGINGRKVTLVSLDDAFDADKTLELTKQLVEQQKVAAIFSVQGAKNNLAIRDYLNKGQVPQLFIVTGADIAADYRKFPWTIGGAPLYRIEAQIYGRRLLVDMPNAKIAVLYQNDDFGKSYPTGLHQVFGADYDKHIVKEASYETSDASVEKQLAALKESGADALITAATPRVATQTISRIFDMGWHPVHFMTFTAISVPSVLQPAGLEKAKGLITAISYMDPEDPRWTEDGSLKPYNDFFAKYLAGEDHSNSYYLTGYVLAQAMVETLKQCGTDLSRENIMRNAANLREFHPVGLLPGVSFYTSRTKYRPIVEAALQRFDGQKWVLFGDVMAGQ